MKFNLKTELPSLLIILIIIFSSFYFYANFPAQVATHWNFRGEADGFSAKTFASFFFPALIIFMYVMFFVLPHLDPKKARYDEFKKAYAIFRHLIVIALGIVYLATGVYNLGYNINIGIITAWTIGLLMIIFGNYMAKIKNNWFLGIRTPWTLSNENVWNRTHRVGRYLFIIFGVVVMIAPFLPETAALILFFGWAIALLIGTFGYSYWAYQQETKKK